MDISPCREPLRDLLCQEVECARSLLSLLQEERVALSGEAAEIERLAAEKQSHLDQLEELHRHRNNLLGQASFSQDKAGMEACLRQCGSDNELKAQWDRLLSVVKECRLHNQMNGAILEHSCDNIRQALAILHGQVAPVSTYGASGKTVEQNLSRSLAKA